ncbi:polysaccharide deacetylase family protein [Pontibacter sp. BAB1700]|uniref:polysaccharide deacetylase family protein n=1 Tax=Pontibacter sp. BAB1700 TaxID=1144253 RepID=UPI0002F1D2A1|nr:polysaccharide deacetylase family protein [Pontibacter sp. BAB1700]
MLTVDDGWESNEANIVEIAAKYEVPVAIFVSTQPVEEGTFWWSYFNLWTTGSSSKGIEALKKVPNCERLAVVNKIKKRYTLTREAMTIEQVYKISLSSVVTIGGHTHSHPVLTNCEERQVYQELNISKRKLESWINKEVAYFAYPNGNYGTREVQALKDSGYKLAFSNVPQYLTRQKLIHVFELPRIGLLEGASLAENICRMVGVWHPTINNIKKLFTNSSSPSSNAVDHKIEKANIGILEK